jgi:hypothetical protein
MLRWQGFGDVCREEPGESGSGRVAEAISQNILISMLLGILLFATFGLGWDWWLALLMIFGSMLILVILVLTHACSNILGYLAYTITWIAIGGYLLSTGDSSTLWLTHSLPLILVIGGRWAARAVRYTMHVPFFLPITLLLILMPLISEDPWRMAATAGWRTGVLATITLVPLCMYLIFRLRNLDISEIICSVSKDLSVNEESIADLWKRIDERRKPSEKINSSEAITQLRQLLQSRERADERLQFKMAGFEKRLKRIAVIRASTVIVGVWIAATLLVYLLAIAIMPSSLATAWSTMSVGHIQAQALSWGISIPTGPYVQVALLLGTVAAAGFAAFVLTEDKYFADFTHAMLDEPANDLVVFGLAYLTLREQDSAGM